MRQTVFIADLHLSDDTPELNRLFAQALGLWRHNTDALYILGDLFEAWLGDDMPDAAAREAAAQIKAFSAHAPVYFICGNRDFLLGERYAAAAGMTLLPEVREITLYGKNYLISHGDEMCTEDKAYLRFRRIMRNKAVQKILLSLPQAWRRKIAADMRAASRRRKGATGLSAITDVSESGVRAALARHPQAAAVIHGHTHRPAIHHHTFDGREVPRCVLPDWHDGRGGYLAVSETGCEMRPLPEKPAEAV
ncbi:UDP-2,3-diacylglucosamine hydrolase [Kingella potus]|uniref:UDP-2,3-diacylglucosamine hydrolase n=1 Tax=Kingella potus TaxID=265175 RepID=A0A377R104_9NEIS|nr:UDP-2,3-diacylglucosamine diphosphatase [Kingella potus]UOP00351.1 UDP-2,3-diacylglucosamine diphosphatase [Kingella potus]STR02588.1 UDP-2,3-diacylglucosamine hydrolase [Kingella potus]